MVVKKIVTKFCVEKYCVKEIWSRGSGQKKKLVKEMFAQKIWIGEKKIGLGKSKGWGLMFHPTQKIIGLKPLV